MGAIALNIGLWAAKIVLRALLRKISDSFSDKLKPAVKEYKAWAAETENKTDDKVADFLGDVVGVE